MVVGLVQVPGGEPFESARDGAEEAVSRAVAACADIGVLPESCLNYAQLWMARQEC